MEFMTITLIDEARYDAEMDETVLPALRNCMAEGWMEPATVDCVKTAHRAYSAVRW